MRDLFLWLQSAPQSIVSTFSAILAAAVALTVVFLTQMILSRRARRDFLTKKLEELYLLILDWLDTIDASKFKADRILKGEFLNGEDARREFSETIRGPRMDRRVNMYILLYFPALKKLQAQLHESVRVNSRLLRLLDEGQKTEALELQRAWLQLHITLSELQGEIENNCAYFVGDKKIKPRYQHAPSS